MPAPVRSVAGLARGTVIAQIALLATIPISSRLYDANAFGVFGIFSTASAALALAASGRFEQGIVPATNDRTATGLFHLSLGIICLVAIAVGAVLEPVLRAVRAVAPAAAMPAGLYWLPLGIGAQAVGQVLLQWATRKHNDLAIMRYYAERTIVMGGAQIAFGIIGTPLNGLILGQIVGFSFAALRLGQRLRDPGPSGAPGPALTPRAACARALGVARLHVDFPRYGLPRTMLEAAAAIALPTLISALYGAAAMGAYWMALRILALPGSVLGDPILRVFYRKASELRLSGTRIMPVVFRAFLGMCLLTVPFAVLLVVGSGPLFRIFLGPSWNEAALFVKILSVGWIATFSAPLIPLVMILLGLQKQHFLFEIALRVFEASAVVAGYALGGVLASLSGWAIVNIANVLLLLWFLGAAERRSVECAGKNGGEKAAV